MSGIRWTQEALDQFRQRQKRRDPAPDPTKLARYAGDANANDSQIPTLTDVVTAPKGTKYRNRVSGRFASVKERRRAAELELLFAAGEITDLAHADRDPKRLHFLLIPKQKGERACWYIADAVYRDRAGKLHVEDTKSEPTKTPVYRVKRKLLLLVHGVRIEEL